MNKKNITSTLNTIMESFTKSDFEISVLYRGEISHLVRAGRNQISLNVAEEGSKYFITLVKNKKTINSSLSAKDTDSKKVVDFILKLSKQIDFMSEIPHLKEPFDSADGMEKMEADLSLKKFDSSMAIKFFENAYERFKPYEIELSGAFSVGFHNYAYISSRSKTLSYYETTDFNIELVLQLVNDDKKELRVSSVGRTMEDYKPQKMYEHLEKLLHIKKKTKRVDLKPGPYDVIFHADAFSEMIAFMTWIAINGDSWLYQTGMLKKGEHEPGVKVFGDNFHLTDDPDDEEVLFHRPFGLNGIVRPDFTPFDNGVLNGFYYDNKDTCDKFNIQMNNCSQTSSLKLRSGDGPSSFEEMIDSCENTTLYIPFIHYMNFTNPAKGEFTGTGRFGTFLINEKKIHNHLFNLRINESFFHIFNNIDWLSKSIEHVNLSNTYGLRLAGSMACPRYVKVKNVKITGSSSTSKS